MDKRSERTPPPSERAASGSTSRRDPQPGGVRDHGAGLRETAGAAAGLLIGMMKNS